MNIKKQNIIVDKKKDGVVCLYFNRQEAKNALNMETIIELKENIKVLKYDNSVRILIITGTGDTFSSGADLKWMKSSKKLNFEDNKRDAIIFVEMLKEIDEFPKPTLSIINGHAFGGALGIIAVSDFSVANMQAKFSFSEVKLGIIPAMIGPYVLRSIGFKNSKKLFLTGEIFNTQIAKNINLIDEFLPSKEIEDYTSQLIAKLKTGSPKAQKEIKEFLRNIYSSKIDKALINKTADTISKIRVSKEAQSGIEAFLKKKKPNWI